MWRSWDAVRGRIARSGRVLFLLDFDGTLAPIETSPAKVRLPGEIRALLAELGRRPRARVAVLSGRSLADVRSFVNVRHLYYGGNHGLEIRGPAVAFRHPGAVAARPAMRQVAARARDVLRPFAGALVEDKGLTLSLHYRQVRPRLQPALRRALARLREETSTLPVRWKRGRKVWEILPGVSWDKGAAARYLLRRLPGSLPLAVGDDTTDEDLFAALGGRGVSVRVDRARTSGAEYFLGGQKQIARFLRLAAAALDGSR